MKMAKKTEKKGIENMEKMEKYDPIKSIGEMEKQIPEKVKKEIEKVRNKLKEFKKAILKKFPYIQAIGILPPLASKIIEEEEEIEKQKDEKLIHVIIIVPDEKDKELNKLMIEGIKYVQGIKPKIWLHIKTTKQLWELGLDAKYAFIEAIAMSLPLYDKGILGALRVTSVHKTLTLKKFERYVVSYVVTGSLVRGQAIKTSDVDVFIVIDDTDVKRMSRYELREKLRAIIYAYAIEASEIAGVKNKLSPQIYILTEFWEAVKDAHPVIFTMIRDGIPLYDRGAFMPWKLLLQMGKIKPSPEAIDMFMSLGERVAKTVQRKLNDIVTEDIYWGVITPSQAVLMLYGIAPPVPKETANLMKEIFVKREKILEQKYVDILRKIVIIYKKYEHEKIKTISGKEIDKLLEQSSDYIKRLKDLMDQIEKKAREREILQIYETIFNLLEGIFGKAKETILMKKFEEELIKKTKLPQRSLRLLKKIVDAKKKYQKGKLSKQDLGEVRKVAHELTSQLLEYTQRRELLILERNKISLLYKTKKAGKEIKKRGEVLLFKDAIFIIPDITSDTIKKFSKDKMSESSKEEIKKYISKKEPVEKRISPELLSGLRKLFGDFELIF